MEDEVTLGLSVGLDRTQYLFYLEPLIELEIKPLAPSTACSSPFMLPAIALKLNISPLYTLVPLRRSCEVHFRPCISLLPVIQALARLSNLQS